MSTCRFLKIAFTTPPPIPMRPIDRYGFLVVILGILIASLWLYLRLPPHYSGDPYRLIIVGLMLLFSHLAYNFAWRPSVTVAVRVLSWSWTIFACFYLLYLTRVLYP